LTHRPIRVLTLIESNTVTGPARNVIRFATMAARAEGELPAVEVTILTYRRGPGESPLAVAAAEAGLSVITVAERRRWDTRVLPQLRRVVAQQNPDILETRNVKSHFLVRLLGLHRSYPWVAWNHGYTTTSWLDRAYTQLDRWSLRGAYRMITMCRPFADVLVARGVRRERITLLHNCVTPFVAPPPEEVAGLRRSLELADDEAVILAVGRLSREKGHAGLLRAAAALNSMSGVPPFRVVLVGEGPERPSLLRLASQLALGNRVLFAGFQRDPRPYYALATLVAVPSHSEGSPNVVLESMAAARPIVANAVGGIPEILEDGVTGLLVQPGNPEAMARAIGRILSDRELAGRLGATALARVASGYTPESYRRKLVSFYQETLANAPAS